MWLCCTATIQVWWCLDEWHHTAWQLVKYNNKNKLASTKSNVTGFVAAKGTVSVVFKKHKLDDNDTEQVNKKIKMSEEDSIESHGSGPL